jgi:molybdopterin synthase sulfur carrier subunit
MMPTVLFTTALQRLFEARSPTVVAATVNETLAAVFATRPKLRGYVLDDQGALRPHVNVFVNGAPVSDRSGLSDPVKANDEIYVFQALTGG